MASHADTPPIGVPHHPLGEEPPFGGQGWICSPPNSRIAPWWRLLHKKWSKQAIPDFSLSLEVTHHGPVLDVPALFIEVGSTEPYWPNENAAQLLAEIITEGLSLNGSNESYSWSESNETEPVLITLGGGHYARRQTN